MVSKERLKTYNLIILGVISLGIIGLFLYGLWEFLGGLLGAIVLYVLLKPIHNNLVKKKGIGKRVSAFLLISFSVLIVVIPLAFIIFTAQGQIIEFLSERGSIIELIRPIDEFIPQINFSQIIKDRFLSEGGGFISNFFIDTLGNATRFVINLFIMLFTLYYLLVDEFIIKKFKKMLPLGDEQTEKLSKEFKKITYSTMITTGLVAIMQGFLLGISFYIAGINGAILLGVISAILAFIPIVGTPIVWIPVSFYVFVQGNPGIAIGLAIWGLIVSNVDNLIRPYLQNKVGEIHPLVTLVGVFLGISLFGVIGVIAGPLLISYSLILFKMFKQEYLKG